MPALADTKQIPFRTDPARCPLIVLGAWNQAIFTPEFVSRYVIADSNRPDGEIGLGPSGPRLSFGGPEFTVTVLPDRTIWVPRVSRREALAAIESTAIALLQVLKYTPISAVGINFGFSVDEPRGLLAQLLELPDAQALARDPAQIRRVQVIRSIATQHEVLNLGIAREGLGPALLDLNFHHDVPSADAACELLRGALLSRRKVAVRLLDEVYDLREGDT